MENTILLGNLRQLRSGNENYYRNFSNMSDVYNRPLLVNEKDFIVFIEDINNWLLKKETKFLSEINPDEDFKLGEGEEASKEQEALLADKNDRKIILQFLQYYIMREETYNPNHDYNKKLIEFIDLAKSRGLDKKDYKDLTKNTLVLQRGISKYAPIDEEGKGLMLSHTSSSSKVYPTKYIESVHNKDKKQMYIFIFAAHSANWSDRTIKNSLNLSWKDKNTHLVTLPFEAESRDVWQISWSAFSIGTDKSNDIIVDTMEEVEYIDEIKIKVQVPQYIN